MGWIDFADKYLYVGDPEMVLLAAGIIPELMEFLTYSERVCILQKAGLDPKKFDF